MGWFSVGLESVQRCDQGIKDIWHEPCIQESGIDMYMAFDELNWDHYNIETFTNMGH